MPNSIDQLTELLLQSIQNDTSAQFDMNDDTFANLLNSQLASSSSPEGETYIQLMGPLGVPAGLNIEGLTVDPFKTGSIAPSEFSEMSIDQSEIGGNDDDVIKSSGNRIEHDFFEQIGAEHGSTVSVTDLLQMASSPNTIKSAEAQDEFSNNLGNFMKKQASNLYSTMNKSIINNLGDLLSAI